MIFYAIHAQLSCFYQPAGTIFNLNKKKYTTHNCKYSVKVCHSRNEIQEVYGF